MKSLRCIVKLDLLAFVLVLEGFSANVANFIFGLGRHPLRRIPPTFGP